VAVGKLKDYSTSKKDMKRGVEIVPEENYRLRGEDKFTPRKDFDPTKGTGSDANGSASYGQKGSSVSSSSSTASTTASLAATGLTGGGEQFGDDYHPVNGFRDTS
jgi:serum/glucocorticoid-regulated kinase 2